MQDDIFSSDSEDMQPKSYIKQEHIENRYKNKFNRQD
jgi:hypothetical protein